MAVQYNPESPDNKAIRELRDEVKDLNKILKQAIESALDNQKIITDESSAVELMGLQPKMVLGCRENFKVTYPEDLI